MMSDSSAKCVSLHQPSLSSYSWVARATSCGVGEPDIGAGCGSMPGVRWSARMRGWRVSIRRRSLPVLSLGP